MDAYLAVVSKRDVRDYTNEAIDDQALERILEAGRASGSSRNRQPWTFIVIRNRELLKALGETASVPANFEKAPLAIAVVTSSAAQAFDAGRAAQNMMIAAWAESIMTCPNSVTTDRERAKQLLGLEPDQHIPTVLTLGHPAKPVSPENQRPKDLLRRINRKPLEALVEYR